MTNKLRWLAALLCLVLALGAAGCNTTDTSWAFEAGGEKLPAGVYLQYMLTAYQEAEERYMEDFYAGAEEGEVWIYPEQKDLLAYNIDGVDAGSWIRNRAQDYIRQYYGAQQLAGELGHTLSATGEATVQNALASYWSGYSDHYTRNGISQSSLETYLRAEALKTELIELVYGAQGADGMSDGDIAAILNRDYVKASIMEFAMETLDEEEGDAAAVNAANEELRALADSYVQRMAEGEAVDELVYEYRLSIAEDPDTVTKPDKANWQFMFERPEAPMGYELYDTLADTAVGAGGVLEDMGYYVAYYRHDLTQDEEALTQYRTTILIREMGDAFEGLLLEKSSGAGPINANDAAVSRYTADQLSLTLE